MCRLYGFRATELTKIECTLVHAQNALIVQSCKDRSGTSHLHGWGLAAYQNGKLHIEREVEAAVEELSACRQQDLFRSSAGPPGHHWTGLFGEHLLS